MKNPFITNFLWLSFVIILFSIPLLCSTPCGHYCFSFKPRTENIFLGILSSAILLLFIEIINFIYDRKKYGFLSKNYKRVLITQKNNGDLRSSDILKEIIEEDKRKKAREKKEKDECIRFINDSCYHELLYYNCNQVDYLIQLDYHYHGIYTGFVEYFDHEKGNWKENKMEKIKAKVTLNLNTANKMTGSGSYKYLNCDDFGRYEFQIDEQNPNRIIVSYCNTIPSGLAEGYEVWEKYKKRICKHI